MATSWTPPSWSRPGPTDGCAARPRHKERSGCGAPGGILLEEIELGIGDRRIRHDPWVDEAARGELLREGTLWSWFFTTTSLG